MNDIDTLIDESGMNRKQISAETGVSYAVLTAFILAEGSKAITRDDYNELCRFFQVEDFTINGKEVLIKEVRAKKVLDPEKPTERESKALDFIQRMLSQEDRTVLPKAYKNNEKRLFRHLMDRGILFRYDTQYPEVIWRVNSEAKEEERKVSEELKRPESQVSTEIVEIVQELDVVREQLSKLNEQEQHLAGKLADLLLEEYRSNSKRA